MRAKLRLVLIVSWIIVAAFFKFLDLPVNSRVAAQVSDCYGSKVFLSSVFGNRVSTPIQRWEQEPNDTSRQPTGPIESGETYYGYPNDQQDFFSFDMQSNGQITITLENLSGSGRRQLQLYYESTNNDPIFDATEPFQIVRNNQPAGHYLILVYVESGHNSDKSYTLRADYPTSTSQPTPTDPIITLVPTCTPTDTPTSTLTPTPTPTGITGIPDCSQPPSNPTIGSSCVDNTYGITFVYVPAGEFLMGSTDAQVTDAHNDCLTIDPNCERRFFEDEMPQHKVNLDAFWITKTEVTNAQYKKCVDAGKCTRPSNNYWDTAENSQFPVTDVDWNQASTYAVWVGGRLPTEAEWEKAARGTDGRIYPWGNDWDASRANYCDGNCSGAEIAPAGYYTQGVSPYGAFNMSGNVGEWVADYYDANYYSNAPPNNPTGPATGGYHVWRSGSFYKIRPSVRTASRTDFLPCERFEDTGFRVMRGVPSGTPTPTPPPEQWCDNFNREQIDQYRWLPPTDADLIFAQNEVLNLRVTAAQSQGGGRYSELKAILAGRPISEVAFTVALQSFSGNISGAGGLAVDLENNLTLSIDVGPGPNGPGVEFSICHTLPCTDYDHSYHPDGGAFPVGVRTPMRMVWTGETVKFYVNNILRVEAPTKEHKPITGLHLYTYADKGSAFHVAIDNVYVTYSSTATPTPTVTPSPTSQFGYNFEAGTQNWTTSEGAFKYAVLDTTKRFVYSGFQALRLTTELRVSSEEVLRHTEATAYFNNAVPEGFSLPGPYNLTGKSVSCFVYLPSELAPSGNPEAYIKLFVKDKDFRNQFNTALDIVPSNVNKWLQLSLVVGQGGGMDPGFDSKQINALGIRIDLHSGATLSYVGPIYIDHCSIEPP